MKGRDGGLGNGGQGAVIFSHGWILRIRSFILALLALFAVGVCGPWARGWVVA